MRRFIYILLIITTFILILSIFIKPIILFSVKSQLRNIFIGSAVYVAECRLVPTRLLILSNIEINNGQIYNFKIKEVEIRYNLLSVLKRKISRVCLKDVAININFPQRSILELKQLLRLSSKSIISLESLEFLNLSLDVKSKEVNANAKVSLGLNLARQLIDYLDISVESLSSRGFNLQNAYLLANQVFKNGYLHIQKVKYDKLKTEEIKSGVRLEQNSLFLDDLSARIFDGWLEGNLKFSIAKMEDYSANLRVINLDLETFVKDFKLTDRFEMTGRLNGGIILEGSASRIEVLKGNLSTSVSGGVLNIKDNEFLENLARDNSQPLSLVVESFRNYHYNTGVIKLFLERRDLILTLDLEGEAGKRNLKIILHNFKPGRTEQ